MTNKVQGTTKDGYFHTELFVTLKHHNLIRVIDKYRSEFDGDLYKEGSDCIIYNAVILNTVEGLVKRAIHDSILSFTYQDVVDIEKILNLIKLQDNVGVELSYISMFSAVTKLASENEYGGEDRKDILHHYTRRMFFEPEPKPEFTYVTNLKTTKWFSFSEIDLKLHKGVNLIYGGSSSGKSLIQQLFCARWLYGYGDSGQENIGEVTITYSDGSTEGRNGDDLNYTKCEDVACVPPVGEFKVNYGLSDKEISTLGLSTRLNSTGTNLSDLLDLYKKYSYRTYEEIVNSMQLVIPNFKDFSDRNFNGYLSHYISSDDIEYTLTESMRTYLYYVVLTFQNNPPKLVIIDNFGDGLSLEEKRFLIAGFKQTENSTQYIITTRQLDVVDLVDDSDLYITIKLYNERSPQTYVSKVEADDLEGWRESYSLSELISMNVLPSTLELKRSDRVEETQ